MRSNINCESQKVVIDSFSPPTLPKVYLLLYGVNPLWNIIEMSTQYRVVYLKRLSTIMRTFLAYVSC